MVYVKRFLQRKKASDPKDTATTPRPISTSEFHVAEKILLREMTTQKPPTDKLTKMYNIQSYADDILRITSDRFNNLPNTEPLIYLPDKHHGTTLIISHIHAQLLHNGGSQHTLNQFRQTFWSPNDRQQTRQIVRSCCYCKRFTAFPYALPKMADFPSISRHLQKETTTHHRKK